MLIDLLDEVAGFRSWSWLLYQYLSRDVSLLILVLSRLIRILVLSRDVSLLVRILILGYLSGLVWSLVLGRLVRRLILSLLALLRLYVALWVHVLVRRIGELNLIRGLVWRLVGWVWSLLVTLVVHVAL